MRKLFDVRNVSTYSGSMAAGLGAAAEIWHLRNGNTKALVVPKLQMTANVNGTAFTAGRVVFTLLRYNGWSADGTGGAAADLSAQKFKVDAFSGESGLMTAITWRTATTAALGAGTKTLDVQLVSRESGVGTAVSDVLLGYQNGILLQDDDYPIVLNPTEGLVLQATVPATGVWSFGIDGKIGFVAT